MRENMDSIEFLFSLHFCIINDFVQIMFSSLSGNELKMQLLPTCLYYI